MLLRGRFSEDTGGTERCLCLPPSRLAIERFFQTQAPKSYFVTQVLYGSLQF